MKNALIITTINSPRKEIEEFSKISNIKTICIGDKKSPDKWGVKNVVYLSANDQNKIFPKFSKMQPWNCYGRKNIGYLYAIKNKFDIIIETDDDVYPYNNFPQKFSRKKRVDLLLGEKFINIYKLFGAKNAWPRGFPLNYINKKASIQKKTVTVYAPVQNYVINQDSDFDAIYRLISSKPVKFNKHGGFALGKGCYCPLNSQCTLFYPEVYPLLYIPSFVNPRVEDILRGYIAQRIIWEIGGNLFFGSPITYTANRNPHNFLKDFENELSLYLQTEKLINILDSISLTHDINKSLIKIYSVLAKEKFVTNEEVKLVNLWIKEVEKQL